MADSPQKRTPIQSAAAQLTAVPLPTTPVAKNAVSARAKWHCTVCDLKMNIVSKESHLIGKKHAQRVENTLQGIEGKATLLHLVTVLITASVDYNEDLPSR